MYGLVQLLPNVEYRDHGSKHCMRRMEMNLAASLYPLPLLPCFHGNEGGAGYSSL